MTKISLSSVVNETFVNRFAGLAKSQGGSASSTGQSDVVTTLTNGLRAGAQNFAAAVQGVNAVISFLNITDSALQKLGKITDKAISLAESSVESGAGSSTRDELTVAFQKLGREFKKTLQEAKVNDREYLKREGLEDLFTTIGLSPQSASGAAKIFDDFVFAKGDTEKTLASDQIKGERPVPIPASAYDGSSSSSEELVSIFDASTDLTTRPEAYRVLNDLTALKKQLTENREAIGKAREFLGENLSLVRAAGFAFLDVSKEITSSDTAQTLANKIQREIRANAPQALAQAENLEPMTVAALSLTQESFN